MKANLAIIGKIRAGLGSGTLVGPVLWVALISLAVGVMVISLGIGRYHIRASNVLAILSSNFLDLTPTWKPAAQRVVLFVRLPRILLAFMAGVGLSLAGAGLQGVFRNPLAGPQIIGVSSGAAFGGVLAILWYENHYLTILFSFAAGMAALAFVYIIGGSRERSSVLTLVLAGVVTGAFFSALISLVKLLADPFDKLPAIVIWLMGSFATATFEKVFLCGVPLLLGAVLIYLLRFRLNLLSLGDEEAAGLGLKVAQTRWLVLTLVTLCTAPVVAVSGVIGWVGLVIPHFARLLVGPDHRSLLPGAALMGGIYVVIIDDLARTLTPAEIPLGILTALIGAPIFVYLLKITRDKGWKDD